MPGKTMRDALARDYEAMVGMVFGEVPTFDAVLASVEKLEADVNRVAGKRAS